MKKTKRSFWKLIFLALACTFLFVLIILLLIWQRLDGQQSLLIKDIAYANAYYLLALITIVPVALWVIFEICFTRFYLPLKRIPAEISLIYRTNLAHRLALEGSGDIIELSEAINDFARRYEYLNDHISEEIDKAGRAMEKDRNLLASIMAELPLGIIICNSKGRILLFNTQAKGQFGRNREKEGSEYFLGLGRSIYHLIDRLLINQALNEVHERLARRKRRVASYFVTHIEEHVLILVETIPVLDQEQQLSGFVLSIRDISETVARYETIRKSLISFAAEISACCARISALLNGQQPCAVEDRLAVEHCLRELQAGYSSVSSEILDAAFETIPLGKLEVDHFLFLVQKTAGLEKNIRINVAASSPNSRILGDTYSFVAAFVFIVEHLAGLTSLDEFTLSVHSAEKEVTFIFSWEGPGIERAEIDKIVDRKIAALTRLGYVLKQNKASFIPLIGPDQRCTQLRISARAELALPHPGHRRSPVTTTSRPEYYDFNLFHLEDENPDLLNSRLSALTYSVIDTETTGLDPDGGDEIIALGAVRIVNNRIAYDDCFDQLVNPGRDIPFASFKIHGIDPAMVADKPAITAVLPAFKRYVSDTVILGHDVAFDLKMLKLKEVQSGIAFPNPVLDTLLLSAMLHPVHKQHDLGSIARRLGVTIVGRHTAIGDAIATAEVFIRLIPILQSKGIETLGEAIQASKRTYFRRLRY